MTTEIIDIEADSETQVNDTTETMEQYLGAMSEEEKLYNLTVWMLLRSSPKFIQYLDSHFSIGQRIDHDKKTVELVVAEKPVADRPIFKISDEQAAKIGAMLRQVHQVANPASCLLNILDIINGRVVEESGLIVANEGDMNKELATLKALKGN